MNKSLFFSLLLLAFVVSCDRKQDQLEPSTNYNQISQELESNLSFMAQELRNQNANFSDLKIVNEVALQNVDLINKSQQSFTESEFIEAFERSLKLVESIDARSEPQVVYVSEFFYNLIHDINELWIQSDGFVEYLENLNIKKESILNSDLKESDKETAVIYLSSQIASIDFVLENTDLVSPDLISSNGRISQDECNKQITSVAECEQSWWDSWGKCAAGIVGGAGVAAIGGCSVGAQVGLGFASIPGCGVGAILGGIFGGLGGAAATCGSGGNAGPACGPIACPYIDIRIP